MRTLFYSWQSDLPNSTNRGFIDGCIKQALKELGEEEGVAVFKPDRALQGSSGNQKIADNIFAKIDKCSAFVADVSFINGALAKKAADGAVAAACSGNCTRLSPNPNVMAEWGWALRSVGDEHVICVLNEATGSIEDLPFDMRGRNVVSYRLAKVEGKTEAKKLLVGKLKNEIRGILALPLTMMDLQFADPETHAPLGKKIERTNTAWELETPFDQLPSYGRGGGGGRFDLSALTNGMVNSEYYREKAGYIWCKDAMRAVALRLENTGGRLMNSARFEATVSKEGGYVIMEERGMAKLPSRTRDLPALRQPAVFEKLKRTQVFPGRIDVRRRGENYHLKIAFGDIQAGAKEVSEVFYIGSVGEEGKLRIAGHLYADQLDEPIPATLSVTFQTTRRKLSLDGLRADLPEERLVSIDD